MTVTTRTSVDHLIPDEIAQHAVLPASYADEESMVYPAYAWLRKNNPLGLAKLDNYDPLWLVTKYADLFEVERQPDLFTSGVLNPILADQPGDAFIRSMTGGSYRTMDVVVYMDPPEHTKVRAVASKWFMPRNVRRYEAQMRELARQAVDRVLAMDGGECDFVQDFALGYPLHVMMSLFGVPERDEPILLKLTQEFFGVHDDELGPRQPAPDPEAATRQTRVEQEMTEYRATTTQSSVTGDPTGGTVALLAVVAILLGLQLAGAVPAASAGLFVPVLLLAGTGMLLLGLLAVRKGENIIGLFFSTFGPFVVSFGLLIIGLEHGWWGIPPADVPHAEGAFLMAWTIVLTVWFFLSLVLPAIFTVLLTFVDIALWCLAIGIWNTSAGPQKVAGWMLLATGAGALYFGAAIWLGWVGFATLPIGRPLIQRSQREAALASSPAAP